MSEQNAIAIAGEWQAAIQKIVLHIFLVNVFRKSVQLSRIQQMAKKIGKLKFSILDFNKKNS